MNATKIAPELCPPKVEPEWDQCTTGVLLREALACLSAVEEELKDVMPQKANEVGTVVDALERIISHEGEIIDWVIQNYKDKLRKTRKTIRNKPWPTGKPHLPPWKISKDAA